MDVHMPPAVEVLLYVTPKVPSAPVKCAPSAYGPFIQSKKTQMSQLVPLDELGGLCLDLEEIIREIPAVVGPLRPLIFRRKKKIALAGCFTV